MTVCLLQVVNAYNITDYVITDLLLNESFPELNYDGWSFSQACNPGYSILPVVSPYFSTYAWGFNGTNPCGSGWGNSHYAHRTITNVTSGTLLGIFNVSIDNANSIPQNPAMTFTLCQRRGFSSCLSSLYNFEVRMLSNGNITIDNGLGGQECGFQLSIPYVGEVIVEFDIDNNVYDLFFNKTSYCENRTIFSAEKYFEHTHLWTGMDTGKVLNGTLDDIVVGKGYTLGEANCTDFDGLDYFTSGYIIEEGTQYNDTCQDSTNLREYICVNPGLIDYIDVDCSVYGMNCYDGKCTTTNQQPVIQNMTSYRNESSYPYQHHHAWYSLRDRIWFELNITDWESDTVYTAVDCDISTPPYVSLWGPANQNDTKHYNCTYNSTGNYTSRIFITDSSHAWGDYSVYQDDNITINECVTYEDCDPGYWCSADGNCYIPGNVTNCTDTDSGINYTVFGTISTPVTTVNDTCYSGSSVQEYYCDSGFPGGIRYNVYACQNIDSDYICYEGYCRNDTNSTEITLTVKDLDTSLGVSGIQYTFVQYPSYTVVSQGLTPDGGIVTISLELGYDYQLILEDSTLTYKDWYEPRFTPSGDITSYMEKYCIDSCVFNEFFSYADSPYHHGWRGANYTTYYHTDYGFMGDIDLSRSVSSWYVEFPQPSDNIQLITYDLIMTESTPGEDQDISVYLEDISGNNIFLMRYEIDDTETGHVYYYDTSWHEITLVQNYVSTQPIRTKLQYDESSGKIDIYIDSLVTGNYILYISNSDVINALTLQRFNVVPDTPTVNKSIYIDNIEIYDLSVEEGEEEEGSPTDPSQEDLETPWYTDASGDVKFDATKCEGWKSYIMCGVWKYSIKTVATGVSWVFTGVHLLYFLVIIIIIVIIGPLIIELFKKR